MKAGIHKLVCAGFRHTKGASTINTRRKEAGVQEPRSSFSSTLGLILISASMLSFEISLTRIFAVQQFYHFAFVVVSLAVLAFAASGTLLALKPCSPSPGLLAFLYAVSIALSYLTINFLPFDSYSIAWDQRQTLILLIYFLAAGAPFLLAGWVIGASLTSAGSRVHLAYAANLGGSGLGCVLALVALSFSGEEGSLAFSITLGLIAAGMFTFKKWARVALSILAALSFIAILSFPPSLKLRLSPYKPLATASLLPDARTPVSLRSASARLDSVESQSIHTFPGLSLNAAVSLPEQVALYIDGEDPHPVTALDPRSSDAGRLVSYMPSNLAYLLRPGARTLILDPGAWLEVIIALASGADGVGVSNPEPLISEALGGPYRDFSLQLIDAPGLTLIRRSDRGALAFARHAYDVIQFSLSDAYRPVTSGAFSLGEDYALTIEAIRSAYSLLEGDGLIVITRWLGTPPSESARTWATLLAALEAEGLDDPSRNLIAYRGMRTATMIASRSPFTNDDLQIAREFLVDNGFDPIHLPDLEPSELNRFNRLPSDTYHEIFQALLTDRNAAIATYDFNLTPPSDDQPFFFHYFRWRQTPEILATLGLTWQPFGGSGYFVLLALLGLMIALAGPLVLIPWILLRRNPHAGRIRAKSIAYFAFLGAAYLLVEIPLISRLTLLLDQPAVSLATVLFTLLLASGIGSLVSTRLRLRRALIFLVAAVILNLLLMPLITRLGLSWALPVRILASVFLLFPLGVLMGVPFATGLRRLEIDTPGLIPLAWAVNGAASGIAGVVAVMVALDWGNTAVHLLAAATYLGAWATAPRRKMQSVGG
jgi:hypothetical protein